MGNTEIENYIMIKFGLSKEQSIELREKIDEYIDKFEENHLCKNLNKYLESELKKTYGVNRIDNKKIKDTSKKCIGKKNDWNNLEGYYSFIGYILTVIGQITNFIPSKIGAICTFIISVVVFWVLNKFSMKFIKKHVEFLREFNNNFPSLITISVIFCLAINIFDWSPIISMIAVLGINVSIVMLYLFVKFSKMKRKRK